MQTQSWNTKMASLHGEIVAVLALGLVLATGLTQSAGEQMIPDTCGQQFVFTYPASHPSVTHNAYILVTTYSASPVTVTVNIPGIGFTNTSIISNSNFANISFPEAVMLTRDDDIVNKSIQISATDAVCVYGLCTSGSTADGFTVLPKTALGERYVLASYEPLISYRHPSEFVVTALGEKTTISITFNHDHDPTSIQKVLWPTESFQYRDFDHDVSGTLIESDNPVSVMSGNECANVPNTIGKCEFLITHMPPTEEQGGFGRHFVLAAFLGRNSGFIYRVIAISDNTNVTISDGTSIVLDRFAKYEGDATSTTSIITINTDKDVIVTQYAKGLYSDYKTGDPFMLLVPPTNFFTNNVTFPVTTIPSSQTQRHYINVIVLCEDNLDITVDGRTEDAWADRLNDMEYCVLRKETTAGIHSVGHPNDKAIFAVLVYTFVWRASYGYFAAYNLQETRFPTVAPTIPVDLMPLSPEAVDYPDSAGRHFVFAFPRPTTSMTNIYLLVTTLTTEATSISVSIPEIRFQTNPTVSRSQHANVTLPSNTINRITSATSQRTITVTAQTPVSVFAVVGGSTTVDAFVVLPTISYGNEYVVAAYEPLVSYGHASEFTVSATDQQTRINITFNHDAEPMSKVLQPYETFQYRNMERDITGTQIYSDKPVSVVSGCQCANVPVTVGKCEYIVDHMSSVGSLGKQFVVAPFLGRRSGYVFRVMTASKASLVQLSDGRSFLIPAYDFHDEDVVNDETYIISAENPVMVSQFAKGCYSDYLTGDPFMMMIPPTTSYSSSITFPVTTIETSETQRAYINVVIDCNRADSLVVNGQILTDWNTIDSNQGFCILRRRVPVGVHTIWHTNRETRFAVQVYAFAWRAAYGYMAGFNIQQPVEPTKANPMITSVRPKGPTQSNKGNLVTESGTKFGIPTKRPAQKTPMKGDGNGNGNEIPLNPNDRGNFAQNTYINSGMQVTEKFTMFLCILMVLLILVILFAVMMFWRDWRKVHHNSLGSMTMSIHKQDHNDNQSTDGMAMEHTEPEAFADFDRNPLI